MGGDHRNVDLCGHHVAATDEITILVRRAVALWTWTSTRQQYARDRGEETISMHCSKHVRQLLSSRQGVGMI
ncbi:MAG: hypothetical protein BGO98_41785 [Myxococcales bacterium 68-20]|nr:MAG: hypothetical protein BGO98_41785 [Myxococcales bacterium 68-20]